MGKDEFLEAARQENLPVLEKFLQSKAKKSGPFTSLRRGPGANLQDGSGFTALHHAAVNGHRDAVCLLLKYEASVNVQDNKGSTPLHLAAWGGHLEVVRAIAYQGPSVPHINHQNNGGETALHCAAQYGHFDVAKILLSQKADPTLPSLKAETPLDLASQFGHLSCVELLIQEARLDLLRPYSAEAATAAVFPHTPLHLASRNGHLGVVKVLIRHGHNVNVRTSRGSPLHEAAICGKVEVVRTLMEAGADPGVRSDVGKTVLDSIAEINTPVTKQILGIIKSMHRILVRIEDDSSFTAQMMPSQFRSSSRSASSSQTSSGFSNRSWPESPVLSFHSSSMRSSSGGYPVTSTPSPPVKHVPISPEILPDISGGIYENVLIPTIMHDNSSLVQDDEPSGRKTVGRRNKHRHISNSYRHSETEKRAVSRERRYSERENHPPDTDRLSERYAESRLSDRESRFSDRDSCGKLSDLEDRMSVARRLSENAAEHSYIYDVPAASRTRSSKNLLNVSQASTVRADELDHRAPRIGPALRHHKWKSECSPLDHSTARAIPPPKPPRRSMCPPSPNSGRDTDAHISCYESIFDVHTPAKHDKKSDNELLGESNLKRLSMPVRTGSVDHSSKKVVAYSTDSDDSDSSRHLYANQGTISKNYVSAKFRPVKSERVSKRNAYVNVPPPPLPPKQYQRSRPEVLTSTFKRKPKVDRQSVARSDQPTADPSSEESDREVRPTTLNFQRNHKTTNKDEVKTVAQHMPIVEAGSVGVGSPVPSSPDLPPRNAVVASSCSLSSGASISDQSASTDNIEEVKSEIPFAGLYRGSRVPDEWLSGDDPTMTADGDNSIASSANTFRSLDKGCSTSFSLANHNTSTISNNNNHTVNAEGGSKASVVLSPLDEAEEWARISDIMSSFGGGLTRESVFMAELEKEFQQRLGLSFSPSHSCNVVPNPNDVPVKCELNEKEKPFETVGSWLRSLNLGQYDSLFTSNGFDNLNYLNGLLDKSDLKELQIVDACHVEKILEAIQKLPLVPSAGTASYKLPDALKEWLESIKLSQYMDTFSTHGFSDMERVRKIWEVELSVVLEVSRLGHRKRMLTSLGDRPIEPQLPVSMTPQDIGHELVKLNTDISELKRKLFKELPDCSGRFRRPPESNTNTIKRSNTKRRAAPPPPPRKSTSLRSSTVPIDIPTGDIALRNPSELAAEPLMPQVPSWKHEPTKLLGSSLRYIAEYLGSTHVKELKGTQSTISSIQKLRRNSNTDSADIPQILLSVSYFGVRFIDTVSQVRSTLRLVGPYTASVVCEHEIRNIHCASQDREDMTHFAYITKDVQTDSHYCHVFRVKTKELAGEIVMTIAQAFEVAFQMALKSQDATKRSNHTLPGHNRSVSEHVRSPKPVFTSHNRSLSSATSKPVQGTSTENLLSDSGNFSDKDQESAQKKQDTSLPSNSSTDTTTPPPLKDANSS